MSDLFDYIAPPRTAGHYPTLPGHRGVDTSIRAAEEIAPAAGTLRAKVLAAIKATGAEGLTTNELVDRLGIDRDSLQPRTSELKAQGLIRDSGQRRRNANGKLSIVWAATARGF